MIGATVQLAGVSKEYKGTKVVNSIDLQVDRGEFLTVLGPSGAGKTTVLKMMAGFEQPSAGTIKLNNSDITNYPPYKRNIGMLFQNYALFPHMTVYENIAFPLTIRKTPKSQIADQVKRILDRVKLQGFDHRYPRQLSGGQQQRVALARALVFDPPILLLDEPLAALDKQLRKHMQLEIKHITGELGVTTISVTHDQEEALTMSSRVCVMKDGHIAQVAKPDEIYDKPNSLFVAQFIGEANIIKGKLSRVGGSQGFMVIPGEGEVAVSGVGSGLKASSDVSLVIRPEKLRRVSEDFQGNSLVGTVEEVIYIGEALKASIRLNSGATLDVKLLTTNNLSIQPGEKVKLGWDPEDTVLLTN